MYTSVSISTICPRGTHLTWKDFYSFLKWEKTHEFFPEGILENSFKLPHCKIQTPVLGVLEGGMYCVVIRVTLGIQTSLYDTESSKTHFVKCRPANDLQGSILMLINFTSLIFFTLYFPQILYSDFQKLMEHLRVVTNIHVKWTKLSLLCLPSLIMSLGVTGTVLT